MTSFLQAVIQETDIWWTDVKKAISEFEKDIVSTISNKKGSIIASEKLLRYLEEKNHQRVSAAGQKLSLVCHLKCMVKNFSLKPILHAPIRSASHFQTILATTPAAHQLGEHSYESR